MDIDQMPATAALNPDAKNKNQNQDYKGRDNESGSNQEADPWGKLAAFELDSLLVEGMSPEVQKAIDSLARQIEPLRYELEKVRRSEAYYKQLAEKHFFLDIPGRSEFVRKLRNVLAHSKQLSGSPALAILHIQNGDRIRRLSGRKALDILLKHVVSVIQDHSDKIDMLGSLGGNDFGLILLDVSVEQLTTILNTIMGQLYDQEKIWNNCQINLKVCFGSKLLTDEKTAEEALENVDDDLRAKLASEQT